MWVGWDSGGYPILVLAREDGVEWRGVPCPGPGLGDGEEQGGNLSWSWPGGMGRGYHVLVLVRGE